MKSMSKILKKHGAKTDLIKYSVIATYLLVVSIAGLLQFYDHSNKAAAAGTPSSTTPCVGNAAPSQWKHVVIMMFENQHYTDIIGAKDSSGNLIAPYITDLANKCGTAYSGTTGSTPKNNWHDANYKADGSQDGTYDSKPNYATLTSGVPPSVSKITNDTYSTTTSVDNIYNHLQSAGKVGYDYYDGPASTTPCVSGQFPGAYHDAIRFFTSTGAQSSSPSTYCNTHDKPLSTFMTDVNNNTLPDYSLIITTNCSNGHSRSSSCPALPAGMDDRTNSDNYAKNILTPFFDSARWKSGDTALFFLWDEDTPIPNVLAAPSIQPGSKVPAPSGNPVGHYSALRTTLEMLNMSLFGDTAQAPSLLPFFGGGGGGTTPPPPPPPPPPADNPPTVSLTAPANGATLTATPTNVTADASDDHGITKVEFYDGSTLIGTDTSSPYSVSWNLSGLSGFHTLKAKAYDTIGQTSTSSVSITVNLGTTCTPPPVANFGSVSATVNIPSTTTYHVWSRVMPTSTNNSYYLIVGSNCFMTVGGSSAIPTGNWTWVDYQMGTTTNKTDLNLSTGNQSVSMIGSGSGLKLDRVLFLSSTCVPTGTGDNCVDSTAPTVTLTSPTNNQLITGTTMLSANASDNSGGTGVSKVDFLVDGSTVGTDTTPSFSLNWDSTSVTDGLHTVKATATDAAGNVGSSAVVTITVKNATTDTTKPTAPTNLTVTKNTATAVGLSWGASTDNVGVVSYHIMRNNTWVGTATGTSFTDATVASNTQYTYTVTALDAAGNESAASPSVTVLTPNPADTSAPSAPTNLTVTKNTATAVGLSWGASTDNVGIAGYRVIRNNAVVATTTSLSYTDTTVLPSTNYTYFVVAFDAAGNVSAASNQQSVTTPAIADTTPPSAPSGLAAGALSTQINLSWNGSTDNVGVAGYDIYRNNTKIASIKTTTFGDSTVSAGTTYTYYVVAFDAAGNHSAASNSVSATLPPQPPSNTTLKFTPTNDAWINRKQPNSNHGNDTVLWVNGDPKHDSLLKFNVSGIGTRTVTKAILQLYVTNASNRGGAFNSAGNNWAESTVTWNTAPSVINTLGTLGTIKKTTWVSVDLSNYVTKDGAYTVRIKSGSTDAAAYASSESSTKPQLTVTAQ